MLVNGFLLALLACLTNESRGNDDDDSWFTERKFTVEPGPAVHATRGEVWPKPQSVVTSRDFFVVRPRLLEFKVAGESCEILEKALQRYKQELKALDMTRRTAKIYSPNERKSRHYVSDGDFREILKEFVVNLQKPCEDLPHFQMDEHYELKIGTDDFFDKAVLISQSIWGILRGLETWLQLVHMSPDNNALILNSTWIMDFPRFSHRGLLIDTSRHFLPKRIIFSMLDAMVMSKLNVLHWHIVDDQSFPYQSETFPGLSAKGAYAPTHVYTPADVQSVITYAAMRGIRVIPEFDTPGHTRSWGQAYPELLTPCYRGQNPDGTLGPMNPILNTTYRFMEKLLREIKDKFPDAYVHLGGDEVELHCWETNPQIKEYMQMKNISVSQLEGMYINQIIQTATNLSLKSLVWQEVFDDGILLPNDTVVQIWKPGFRNELHDVTKKGYKALLSSCWYLDSVSSGGDWKKFYLCEPNNFDGNERQKRMVIGGEACMWGEAVDSNNIMQRVWPRASAAAEKLWSKPTADLKEVARRLEEHTCRMNRRNISAQPPNGPGFCQGANFT